METSKPQQKPIAEMSAAEFQAFIADTQARVRRAGDKNCRSHVCQHEACRARRMAQK